MGKTQDKVNAIAGAIAYDKARAIEKYPGSYMGQSDPYHRASNYLQGFRRGPLTAREEEIAVECVGQARTRMDPAPACRCYSCWIAASA